jgi:hypothetical protein
MNQDTILDYSILTDTQRAVAFSYLAGVIRHIAEQDKANVHGCYRNSSLISAFNDATKYARKFGNNT